MTKEKIIHEMILAGISISELAKKMKLNDSDTVSLLNSDLVIMNGFRIMLAISEIVTGKGRA